MPAVSRRLLLELLSDGADIRAWMEENRAALHYVRWDMPENAAQIWQDICAAAKPDDVAARELVQEIPMPEDHAAFGSWCMAHADFLRSQSGRIAMRDRLRELGCPMTLSEILRLAEVGGNSTIKELYGHAKTYIKRIQSPEHAMFLERSPNYLPMVRRMLPDLDEWIARAAEARAERDAQLAEKARKDRAAEQEFLVKISEVGSEAAFFAQEFPGWKQIDDVTFVMRPGIPGLMVNEQALLGIKHVAIRHFGGAADGKTKLRGQIVVRRAGPWHRFHAQITGFMAECGAWCGGDPEKIGIDMTRTAAAEVLGMGFKNLDRLIETARINPTRAVLTGRRDKVMLYDLAELIRARQEDQAVVQDLVRIDLEGSGQPDEAFLQAVIALGCRVMMMPADEVILGTKGLERRPGYLLRVVATAERREAVEALIDQAHHGIL